VYTFNLPFSLQLHLVELRNLSRLKHCVPAGVNFNKFAGTQLCFLACVLAEESAEFIFH